MKNISKSNTPYCDLKISKGLQSCFWVYRTPANHVGSHYPHVVKTETSGEPCQKWMALQNYSEGTLTSHREGYEISQHKVKNCRLPLGRWTMEFVTSRLGPSSHSKLKSNWYTAAQPWIVLSRLKTNKQTTNSQVWIDSKSKSQFLQSDGKVLWPPTMVRTCGGF